MECVEGEVEVLAQGGQLFVREWCAGEAYFGGGVGAEGPAVADDIIPRRFVAVSCRGPALSPRVEGCGVDGDVPAPSGEASDG